MLAEEMAVVMNDEFKKRNLDFLNQICFLSSRNSLNEN